MKTLKLLLATTALAATAAAGHALTATSETTTFIRDGGNTVAAPRTANYCNSVGLASNAVSATMPVPSWASSNNTGSNNNGLAKIWARGGNYGVIAQSASANRNATPAPWDPTATVSDGTAPDPNVKSYALEPIGTTGAGKIISLTFVGDPSASYPMGIIACFTKPKA